MKRAWSCIILIGATVGCATSDEGEPVVDGSPASAQPDAPLVAARGKYKLPALREGYTRLEAKTIEEIAPGADVTYCQYLMAPVERDMDVLDMRGGQSVFGHHAVAFSFTQMGEVGLGESMPCGATEFSDGSESTGHANGQGNFLGSAAGQMPNGAAFRLKKGEGIMLNMHYINASDEPIEGDGFLDVKLAEPDPERKIAAIFISMNRGFELAPHEQSDATMECVLGSDMELVMMANHMHEHGLNATTEVVRAGSGKVEMLRDDPTWSYEMQFNPEYTRWSASEPLTLRAGDTLRTHCNWDNSTDDRLEYPREMCISAGFVLADGDRASAPGTCVDGHWIGGDLTAAR
jgi:hypothetical protein